MDADELKTLIDRLANALQSALLLAIRLESDLKQSTRDASDLLAATSHAAETLRDFRRPPNSEA